MYKINITKLIKTWKNLKNRDVSMNELKPKKGTKVKMVAEGIFQGEEEDMTKPPKWFINFEIKINKKITRLNENFETKPPKWFINFEIKINKRLDAIEKDIVIMKKDIVIMKKDIVNIKKDIVNIKKDITAMKNTPTMKKELKLI